MLTSSGVHGTWSITADIYGVKRQGYGGEKWSSPPIPSQYRGMFVTHWSLHSGVSGCGCDSATVMFTFYFAITVDDRNAFLCFISSVSDSCWLFHSIQRFCLRFAARLPCCTVLSFCSFVILCLHHFFFSFLHSLSSQADPHPRKWWSSILIFECFIFLIILSRMVNYEYS